MKIDLVEIAKEALKDKRLTIKNLSNNKIRISYKNLRGGKPNPFIFPKFIELDKEFAEAIGLYCGDGKLTKNDMKHTEYATIDEDIGKFILGFFRNVFNVKIKNITFEILYKKGSKNYLEKKWSNILNVPANKLIIKKRKRFRNDALKFQINSIIFRKIFQKIIEQYLPVIKENSNLRKAFLRGYFAADGSIKTRRYSKILHIGEITFNYDPVKVWLKNYVIECLKLEGIKNIKSYESSKGAYLRISGWKNYMILSKINLFDRCLRKKNKFLEVMKELQIS